MRDIVTSYRFEDCTYSFMSRRQVETEIGVTLMDQKGREQLSTGCQEEIYVSHDAGFHWPDPLQLQKSLLRLIQYSQQSTLYIPLSFIIRQAHTCSYEPSLAIYGHSPPPEASCSRIQCGKRYIVESTAWPSSRSVKHAEPPVHAV